jgi:hypothetical protein
MLDAAYPITADLCPEGNVTLPLRIEEYILEIEHAIADQEEKDYMSRRWGVGGDYHHCVDHLPDGTPFGFVELDMRSLVPESVFAKFEKQIAFREKRRKTRLEREEQYAGKVETLQNDKFEQIKLQAINSVNTDSVNLRPGVVVNTMFQQQVMQFREEAGITEEDKEGEGA